MVRFFLFRPLSFSFFLSAPLPAPLTWWGWCKGFAFFFFFFFSCSAPRGTRKPVRLTSPDHSRDKIYVAILWPPTWRHTHISMFTYVYACILHHQTCHSCIRQAAMSLVICSHLSWTTNTCHSNGNTIFLVYPRTGGWLFLIKIFMLLN